MKRLILLTYLLILISCKSVIHITEVEEASINIQDLESDPNITELIRPYKSMLDEEMDTEIGTCTQTLTKRRPESTLGNWFTDLLAEASKEIFDHRIDFVVQNYGGLRIGNIASGPVTKRTIYELMPFDNTLVSIKMDYAELLRFINQMAAAGGWPQSAALTYEISDQQAINIKINDTPLDSAQTYYVAMPDYIANGGDDMFYLLDNVRDDPGLLIRDLTIVQIITNSDQGIPISAELDKRIIVKN